jgi:hypothetical protein
MNQKNNVRESEMKLNDFEGALTHRATRKSVEQMVLIAKLHEVCCAMEVTRHFSHLLAFFG